jgi:hypothetical protein
MTTSNVLRNDLRYAQGGVPTGSLTLVSSAVIASKAGWVSRLSGYINSTIPAGTYYLMLFDATSCPPNGAVSPLIIPGKIAIPAGTSDISFNLNDFLPIRVSNGLVIALSTTAPNTLTLGGAYLAVGGY